MIPVCLPVFGSRCHAASEISFIRKAEIMLVAGPEHKRNVVQEACEGNGKRRLKSVSNSQSDRQYHAGSDPKEREGMSTFIFFVPGMCTGVSGHNLAAIRECFEASRAAQLTVGKLLLKIATCLLRRSPPTCSMHSHSISRPAISRSKFVILPVGLSNDIMLPFTSGGHS